jgi:DNA polymerase elongation subunit (family B)
MYGSVYYNKKASKIHWSEYNDAGERHQYTKKWVPSFYYRANSGQDYEYTSIEGMPLVQIRSKSWTERKDAIADYKENGDRIFGSDLPAEDLFILETWPQTLTKVPDIHFAFVDIETEVEDGFPNPHIAKERINLITVYSNKKKKFMVFGLKHSFKNERTDVKYIQCDTEEVLLKLFVKYLESLQIDIISGWNSTGFDIPFIFNRILRVLDKVDLELYDKYLNFNDLKNASPEEKDIWKEEHAKLNWIKRLSPYKQVEKKRIKTKDRFTKELKDSMGYIIHGLTDYDYLELYKQFQTGQKDSYKLDNIGQIELGESKLHHEGTFKDFYTNHWQEFTEYNIQDVNLLVKLDHKLRYISQAVTLSYTCHCQFKENQGTVAKIDCLIYNYLQQKNIILEDDSEKEHRMSSSEGKFEGAYVKDPDPGLYEWLIDVDLASLYPNTIININISPDSKIFQIQYVGNIWECDDNKILKIKKDKNATEEMFCRDIKKLIKDNEYTVSSYNTVFRGFHEKKGIIPEILEHLYKERKAKKKESFSFIQKQKDYFCEMPTVPEDFYK